MERNQNQRKLFDLCCCSSCIHLAYIISSLVSKYLYFVILASSSARALFLDHDSDDLCVMVCVRQFIFEECRYNLRKRTKLKPFLFLSERSLALSLSEQIQCKLQGYLGKLGRVVVKK